MCTVKVLIEWSVLQYNTKKYMKALILFLIFIFCIACSSTRRRPYKTLNTKEKIILVCSFVVGYGITCHFVYGDGKH